jgi:hypothetical protein
MMDVQASKEATILTWHPELETLGYKDPLPVPIMGIQATLSAIQMPEIHVFVQKADLDMIEAAGEESENLPLFLTMLDLAMWTRVFEYANSDKPEERDKAMARLKGFQAILRDLLAQDFEEMEKARRETLIAEGAIRKANFRANPKYTLGLNLTTHKFLKNLQVTDINKHAIEDFQDAITLTQEENEQATLVASGQHLAVPFTPMRVVEDLAEPKDNRIWAVGNINLQAPIQPSTWRIWCDLKQSEIDECREHALSGTQFVKAATTFVHSFPLYMYDHTKCDVQSLKLHVKLCYPTGADRRDKHPQEMWNIHRPYLRCACSSQAVRTCSSNVIWWDHAVWYIINHLDKFFPQSHYPTLMSKYIAFVIWVSGPGRLAVQCQLAFNHTRNWMGEAVMQYAANPQDDMVLLLGYPEAGPRMIEKHVKPASFMIANPRHPSQGPPSKKQRINLNTPPSIGTNTAQTSSAQKQNSRQKTSGGYGRGKSGGGRYGGVNHLGGRYSGRRGRHSYQNHHQPPQQRYEAPSGPRPQQQAYANQQQHNCPHTPHKENLVLAPGQKVCGMFGQTSNGQEPVYVPNSNVSIQEFDNSPIKPRLLAFLDD